MQRLLNVKSHLYSVKVMSNIPKLGSSLLLSVEVFLKLHTRRGILVYLIIKLVLLVKNL